MVSLCNVCRMSGFHRHLFTGRTAPSLPITCTLSFSLSLSCLFAILSTFTLLSCARLRSSELCSVNAAAARSKNKKKKERKKREKSARGEEKKKRSKGREYHPDQTVLLVSFRESRITFHSVNFNLSPLSNVSFFNS